MNQPTLEAIFEYSDGFKLQVIYPHSLRGLPRRIDDKIERPLSVNYNRRPINSNEKKWQTQSILALRNAKPMKTDLTLIEETLSGEKGEEQERIAEEGIKWLELLLKKNSDYGSSVWNVPVLSPGSSVAAAILVRMSDKVSRINSLQKKGTNEIDESLDDTIRDLGAYCLLYLARPKQ